MDFNTSARLAAIQAGSLWELSRILLDMRAGRLLPDDPPTASYIPADVLEARINAFALGDMSEAADILRVVLTGQTRAPALFDSDEVPATANAAACGLLSVVADLFRDAIAFAPPVGFVFLVDFDEAYLTDDDNAYLIEAA